MTNQHYRIFGSFFFLLHQDRLLWLLNAPVIGWWFRWILRIHGNASSVDRRHITRILPNAIFWWQGDKQVAEFRTHAKFSKRLYYAFRPLWWAMHAWDWCVADRWVPELSFGFSTLTAYPDADPETSTVDGVIQNNYASGSGVAWATIIAAAGTGAVDTVASESVFWWQEDTASNTWYRFGRSIYLFDTSSLTSGAVISAAVASIYGNAKGDESSNAPNVNIYTSAPASNTALAAGDFDSLGSVAQCDTPITYAGWNVAGYNPFTFNATGIGNIPKGAGAIAKFGARNANYDVAASAPTWGVVGRYTYMDGYYADQTGTTNDPKLVVTYTTSVSLTPTIGSQVLTGAAGRMDYGLYVPTEVDV